MRKVKKITNPPKNSTHSYIYLQFFGSNMRCKICKGWGGEFGDAKGVGSMCKDCYFKKYGSYD